MAKICVGTIPTKNIGGTGEGPLLQNFKPKLFFIYFMLYFQIKICFSNGKCRSGLQNLNETELRWVNCQILNHR